MSALRTTLDQAPLITLESEKFADIGMWHKLIVCRAVRQSMKISWEIDIRFRSCNNATVTRKGCMAIMIKPTDLYATEAGSNSTSPKVSTKANSKPTVVVVDGVATAQASKSDIIPVTLSEKSLMLSRLLSETPQTEKTQAAISPDSGVAFTRLSQNTLKFLTDKDLALVSDMYADAEKQGNDPAYVDTLAITLGTYRESDNGKRLGGFNEGQFDLEGRKLSSSYSASDTVTVDRILSSPAMNTTRLDPGFVRYILQPTNALSNMANVDFIEQTVTKFSDIGSVNIPPNPKFASFSNMDSAVSNVVIAASKEVVYKAPETQIANINGHWFILDQSLLKDPKALKATGLSESQLAEAKKNNAAVALALLDVDPKKLTDFTTKLLDLLDKK